MEIPEGWDYTESEDFERLAKILCERNGCFFDESNWKDKGVRREQRNLPIDFGRFLFCSPRSFCHTNIDNIP